MELFSIVLTNPIVEGMEDCVQDGRRFTFNELSPDGALPLAKVPTWIFVDWVMNHMAGLEMCRRLRADPRTAGAHLTMVLESNNSQDGRRALRAGADDYLVGPLDRGRVLDRVLALDPKFSRPHATQGLVTGALSIDAVALQVRWGGVPVVLASNEFRLLRFLAENPDRVLTREELITGLGKHDHPLDVRTVDVWIGRLRRALTTAGAGNLLRTVRSVGYVFDTP